MSQVITSQEAEQAIQEIVKRAQTDSDFRQLCLADANAAAKLATGKGLPQGFTLRFIENKGADLTVVLPDPINVNGELADEELEQVAGGNKDSYKTKFCGGSCAYSDIKI